MSRLLELCYPHRDSNRAAHRVHIELMRRAPAWRKLELAAELYESLNQPTLRQSSNGGPKVEVFITGQDAFDIVTVHHGNVEAISPGQATLLMRDLSGSLHFHSCYGKDLRSELVEQRKAVIDSSPPIDRNVSVDNFLENFRAGDKGFVGVLSQDK